MNSDRIKEIQQETAYPDSVSVKQALLKVWNECEQEKAVKNNAVLPHVSGSTSHEKKCNRGDDKFDCIDIACKNCKHYR
jgi:hypothetical protein